MCNFYISHPQGPTLETPAPTHPANDSMWIILPIPKGMNDSFFISWPFSSRNLDGRNSSGFSQMLGSLCTDHRLGTITLPLGILYPWSTLNKNKRQKCGKWPEGNMGKTAVKRQEDVTQNYIDP